MFKWFKNERPPFAVWIWFALCVSMLLIRILSLRHLVDNTTYFFGSALSVICSAALFLLELALPVIKKGNSKFHGRVSLICLAAGILGGIAAGIGQQRYAMVEEANDEEARLILEAEEEHYEASRNHRIGHLESNLIELGCSLKSRSKCKKIWFHLESLLNTKKTTAASRREVLSVAEALHASSIALDLEEICYCRRIECHSKPFRVIQPNLNLVVTRLARHPLAPASILALLTIAMFLGVHCLLHVAEKVARIARAQSDAQSASQRSLRAPARRPDRRRASHFLTGRLFRPNLNRQITCEFNRPKNDA